MEPNPFGGFAFFNQPVTNRYPDMYDPQMTEPPLHGELLRYIIVHDNVGGYRNFVSFTDNETVPIQYNEKLFMNPWYNRGILPRYNLGVLSPKVETAPYVVYTSGTNGLEYASVLRPRAVNEYWYKNPHFVTERAISSGSGRARTQAGRNAQLFMQGRNIALEQQRLKKEQELRDIAAVPIAQSQFREARDILDEQLQNIAVQERVASAQDESRRTFRYSKDIEQLMRVKLSKDRGTLAVLVNNYDNPEVLQRYRSYLEEQEQKFNNVEKRAYYNYIISLIDQRLRGDHIDLPV
jgi:hypothetical protein